MKPYGREKTVKGDAWKKDCHCKKHRMINWWEDICCYLSRTTMKARTRKEIENLDSYEKRTI